MALPNMLAGIVSREFLRVAGGFNAPAEGASPAGGLDVDNAGNVATNGDATVAGQLDVRSGNVVNSTGDLTLDAQGATAHTKIFLKNSDPTFAADVDVERNLVVAGDCQADTFTEVSPVFTGDALASMPQIQAEAGSVRADGWAEVDHETLPPGLKVMRPVHRYRDKQTGSELDALSVAERAETTLVRDARGVSETIFVDPDTGAEFTSQEEWVGTVFETVTRQVARRDLGAQAQFNLRAIRQLLDRVEQLEAQIAALGGGA